MFEWNDRWNGKSEPFWIMIDNEFEILHSEFFMIHKKDVKAKSGAKFKNEDQILISKYATKFNLFSDNGKLYI